MNFYLKKFLEEKMVKRNRNKTDILSQAERALKSAIRKLIREHKRSGHPVIIWQNGRVVKVPAHKLN